MGLQPVWVWSRGRGKSPHPPPPPPPWVCVYLQSAVPRPVHIRVVWWVVPRPPLPAAQPSCLRRVRLAYADRKERTLIAARILFLRRSVEHADRGPRVSVARRSSLDQSPLREAAAWSFPGAGGCVRPPRAFPLPRVRLRAPQEGCCDSSRDVSVRLCLCRRLRS